MYAIYMNDGGGGSVDYSLVLATTSKTTWTSRPLDAPGSYKLAVRSRGIFSGLEEKNVDAVVELILDDSARDLTDLPSPPRGMRAFALAGGKLRVEWADSGDVRPLRRPLGYRVYVGIDGPPDYTTPRAILSWGGGKLGGYSIDLDRLTSGRAYQVGVRAYGACGEEQNTVVLTSSVDESPPEEVDAICVRILGSE